MAEPATTCYVCGEPTWIWHRRGEDFKHGHCKACGAAWLVMDDGQLDLGIIQDEADGRRNNLQFFFEEFTEITETGCTPIVFVDAPCPEEESHG